MKFRLKGGFDKWVNSMRKAASEGKASDITLDILNKLGGGR
jgi:hypothetical protein